MRPERRESVANRLALFLGMVVSDGEENKVIIERVSTQRKKPRTHDEQRKLNVVLDGDEREHCW